MANSTGRHCGGVEQLFAARHLRSFIGLGYLGGWDDHHQRAVHALSLRVIPFTLGGSYYTRRERALAFSVLYDFVGHQWAMSWSLLGFDLYL